MKLPVVSIPLCEMYIGSGAVATEQNAQKQRLDNNVITPGWFYQ